MSDKQPRVCLWSAARTPETDSSEASAPTPQPATSAAVSEDEGAAVVAKTPSQQFSAPMARAEADQHSILIQGQDHPHDPTTLDLTPIQPPTASTDTDEAGASPWQPAQARGRAAGKIPASEFSYDLEAGIVTCPAGVMLRRHEVRRSAGSERQLWSAPGSACKQCALAARCLGQGHTRDDNGRRIGFSRRLDACSVPKATSSAADPSGAACCSIPAQTKARTTQRQMGRSRGAAMQACLCRALSQSRGEDRREACADRDTAAEGGRRDDE
jgi:hypothetical protein